MDDHIPINKRIEQEGCIPLRSFTYSGDKAWHVQCTRSGPGVLQRARRKRNVRGAARTMETISKNVGHQNITRSKNSVYPQNNPLLS